MKNQNKTMERILVKNPYTGREIDVQPILKFMNETVFGGLQDSEGMTVSQIAGREIQDCAKALVGVCVLANREGWDESGNCVDSVWKLYKLQEAFEAMKEIR